MQSECALSLSVSFGWIHFISSFGLLWCLVCRLGFCLPITNSMQNFELGNLCLRPGIRSAALNASLHELMQRRRQRRYILYCWCIAHRFVYHYLHTFTSSNWFVSIFENNVHSPCVCVCGCVCLCVQHTDAVCVLCEAALFSELICLWTCIFRTMWRRWRCGQWRRRHCRSAIV